MRPKIIEITAVGISQIKLLSRLNDTLLKSDYEVHALCTPDEYSEQLHKDINYHPVNISRTIHINSYVHAVIDMVKVFNSVQPDIVHVHTPVAAILGRIAAKITGVEHVVYTAHGFYFHEGMSWLKYNVIYQIEKFFCKFFTDFLFTQSKEDYLLAVNNQFIDSHKAFHISNGIDLNHKFNINKINVNKLKKLKEALGIKESDIVFSFLGRMVKEKGILELFHAFSIVQHEYPNIVLICMGGALPSDRDLATREEVNQFQSHPSIIFTGQVSDPEYYYNLSDIFILPSYREGMPRSIIEAMAMENAIIATNIRGSREEVIDGVNGYLVSPGSLTELVSKMKFLLEHPKKLSSMKQASLQRAQAEYNEADVVRKQLAILNEMTGRLCDEKNV